MRTTVVGLVPLAQHRRSPEKQYSSDGGKPNADMRKPISYRPCCVRNVCAGISEMRMARRTTLQYSSCASNTMERVRKKGAWRVSARRCRQFPRNDELENNHWQVVWSFCNLDPNAACGVDPFLLLPDLRERPDTWKRASPFGLEKIPSSRLSVSKRVQFHFQQVGMSEMKSDRQVKTESTANLLPEFVAPKQ
ncbi:hypothetical protein BCV70DRAFT_204858 [Testicularia cyperi]|uniref:Uncharacterized protein n=1 Tax=Testicularia cyperi TaxID=1882483 RepID=A0A317XUW7_9BASI|nr:hypothetical protein BCV70DRAFT_204858 [Testicularia cyperi]